MAGKRYKAALQQVDRLRQYTPLEAVRLLKSLETATFDETVEVHFRLGLNVRHADQQLRGTLLLPHGTGRTRTVAVFAQGDAAREAEEAGADYVGADDLAARVQEGWTDFDVALAAPDMMGIVGRLGRILGPQGKMPNPRSGTITFDLAQAVQEIKAGKIEYRTENRSPLVHVPIGKKSFDEGALLENYAVVLEEIVRARPAAAKGRYIKTITVASTMGPGVHVDATRTRDVLAERDGATATATAAVA
jgi:large subunit ribosomal protein L1